MTERSDRRSIADRTWDIRQSMFDLLDKAQTTEVPIDPQKLEDVLFRFKLWAGNLGALHQAHKRLSLESRLVDSPEVQSEICEQLDDMQETMQDLTILCSETCEEIEADNKEEADCLVSDPECASRETEASSILSMVSQCLKALFRIGLLVRKATPRDRFERALQQSDFAFTPQFDINYIEERYPKLASGDSAWLTSRLGGANAKRRQFINYVRDHKTKLEVEDMNPTAEAATVAQSSKATTFAVPENLSAAEFLDTSFEAEDDSISLGSASTSFDTHTILRLPSLADLSPSGEYFECPICFTLQSFRKEKLWKIHAYQDLKAYVCTSVGEECEHKMFGNRDTWFNHELEHHHSLYICKLCGCQYTATELLHQHFVAEHGPYSEEEISSLIEHGKLVPSQLRAQDCPFCDEWASILSSRQHQTGTQRSPSTLQADIMVSLTHFKRHVATHQEQLAIFAVPRTVDEKKEHSHEAKEPNSEAASSRGGHSQTTNKDASSTDAPNLYIPFSTWVRVSGLPRDVSEIDIRKSFPDGEFRGVTEIKIMGRFGFLYFARFEDADRAIQYLNKNPIPMGDGYLEAQFAPARLDYETGKLVLTEDAYADNIGAVRATEEITAESRYSVVVGVQKLFKTVAPLCEDFVSNPPSDPRMRREKCRALLAMIRFEVLVKLDLLGDYDDTQTSNLVGQIRANVHDMAKRIRDVLVDRRRDEIETGHEMGNSTHNLTTDSRRVKIYQFRDNDWVDQGTGLCTVNLVEDANGRNEAYIVVDSENDPGRKMLEERVHEGDNLQKQQEPVIVWTQPQNRADMALSFQEASGADAIWKLIDAVQRNVDEDLGALGAQTTEEAIKGFLNQTMPFTEDYIDPADLEKELSRILGHDGWALDRGRAEHHHLNVKVSRLLTETEINSIICRGRKSHEISLDDSNVDVRSTGNSAAPKSLDLSADQSNLRNKNTPFDYAVSESALNSSGDAVDRSRGAEELSETDSDRKGSHNA